MRVGYCRSMSNSYSDDHVQRRIFATEMVDDRVLQNRAVDVVHTWFECSCSKLLDIIRYSNLVISTTVKSDTHEIKKQSRNTRINGRRSGALVFEGPHGGNGVSIVWG